MASQAWVAVALRGGCCWTTALERAGLSGKQAQSRYDDAFAPSRGAFDFIIYRIQHVSVIGLNATLSSLYCQVSTAIRIMSPSGASGESDWHRDVMRGARSMTPSSLLGLGSREPLRLLRGRGRLVFVLFKLILLHMSDGYVGDAVVNNLSDDCLKFLESTLQPRRGHTTSSNQRASICTFSLSHMHFSPFLHSTPPTHTKNNVPC